MLINPKSVTRVYVGLSPHYRLCFFNLFSVAYPPCDVERQRFPLATERGRSILHPYSIVIASLLDMITDNQPGSRQHRAGIERPKWVVARRRLRLPGTAAGQGRRGDGQKPGREGVWRALRWGRSIRRISVKSESRERLSRLKSWPNDRFGLNIGIYTKGVAGLRKIRVQV